MPISRMQQARQMYQQGGEIMPRLNQLGSGVSSAEQMLQGINQRLESAESSLGGGGGTLETLSGGLAFNPMQTPPGSMPLAGPPNYDTMFGGAFKGLDMTGFKPTASAQQDVMSFSINGKEVGGMNSSYVGQLRNYLNSTGQGNAFSTPGLTPLGGGMQSPLASATGRQMYGLGSLVKKAVKGVTGAVKKIAKSDLGKAALLAAGTYGLGGGTFLGKGLPFLKESSGFAFGNILPNLGGIMGLKSGKDNLAGNVLKVGGYGTLLGGALAGMEGEEEAAAIGGERNVEALRTRLTKAYKELRYPEEQIPALVEADLAEYTSGAGGYAEGGRIGYSDGTEFEKYLEGREKFNKEQNLEQLYKEFLENKRRQKVAEQKTMAANGGLMPMGIMRTNKAGTIERDYRETGGFVPVGIKEKADDVPAMLSKNEFVMTADAVRGIGDGNIEKGAQRLYDQMKQAEKRVV